MLDVDVEVGAEELAHDLPALTARILFPHLSGKSNIFYFGVVIIQLLSTECLSEYFA